jgi:hypothetical protein
LTDRLYQKYYFSRPGYVRGTISFYNLCRDTIRDVASIQEIGAGPSNDTSRFLAGIGSLTGVDVSSEVLENESLKQALVYDGVTLPYFLRQR